MSSTEKTHLNREATLLAESGLSPASGGKPLAKIHPPSQATHEEICTDSKIDAPRVFSEKEILDAMLGTLSQKPIETKTNSSPTTFVWKIRTFLAQLFSDDSPKPGTPRISRIVRDPHQNIVTLDAVSPDADGKGGHTEIKYILQGRHGRNQSLGTTLMHTHYDPQGNPESGRVAAEFKKGQWVLAPQ